MDLSGQLVVGERDQPEKCARAGSTAVLDQDCEVNVDTLTKIANISVAVPVAVPPPPHLVQMNLEKTMALTGSINVEGGKLAIAASGCCIAAGSSDLEVDGSIKVDGPCAVPVVPFAALEIGGDPTGPRQVVTVTGPVVVGKSDYGVLSIGPHAPTASSIPICSFAANAGLTIGDEAGSVGMLSLGYATDLQATNANIVVGNEGEATLTCDGDGSSSITARNILVAGGDNSTGVLETDGGLLSAQGSLSIAGGERSAAMVDFPSLPFIAEGKPVSIGDDIIIASNQDSGAVVCFGQPTTVGDAMTIASGQGSSATVAVDNELSLGYGTSKKPLTIGGAGADPGSGVLSLDDEYAVINAGQVTVQSNSSLMGDGTVICASLNVDGELLPGDKLAQIDHKTVVVDEGSIDISGPLTVGTLGALVVDIATDNSYDVVKVTGTATLAGKLEIRLDNFVPTTVKDGPFTILTASAGVHGEFLATSRWRRDCRQRWQVEVAR